METVFPQSRRNNFVFRAMPFQPHTLISTLRYEPPVAPSLQIFQEAAVDAFPMAIVGFAVAFSVAKVYSVKHDYTIDGNQVCDSATSKSYCAALVKIVIASRGFSLTWL